MESTVNQKLESKLQNVLGNKKFKINQLAGDISSRIYFRVFDENKSYIACLNQEGNKRQNQDFVHWRNSYAEHSIRVPEILHHEDGFILQEDVGAKTFLGTLFNISSYQLRDSYRDLIDSLIKIHSISQKSNYEYDHLNLERFEREVNYTYTYLLKGYFGFSQKNVDKISIELSVLLGELDFSNQVVSHRDYHSKNIMSMNDEKFCVIDFQDTMIGSPFYDLASLLNDCYTNLNSSLKNELLEYYSDHCPFIKKFNKADMEYQFELYSLQRVFKALGNFAAVWEMNQNPYYLRYIAFGMEKIRAITMKYDSMKQFQKLLFENYYG